MAMLIVIIVIIGLAGIIGNQYSGLQRMNEIQKTLSEIKDTLNEKKQ